MWILPRAKIKQINSTARKSDGMDDGIEESRPKKHLLLQNFRTAIDD
jgi:hypothetical protein